MFTKNSVKKRKVTNVTWAMLFLTLNKTTFEKIDFQHFEFCAFFFTFQKIDFTKINQSSPLLFLKLSR